MISIVIPARNEEQHLPRCLEAIKVASSKVKDDIEIIVVINRCTDRTESIAKDKGCKVVKNESKNLSQIRNTGIKSASGEIIVTIDADSWMSENLLFEVKRNLETNKYIGGGVMIYPERYSLGIICSFMALAPFVIYWGISAGVFFGYKNDIEVIGGFDENLYSAEDVDFARRLKKYGKTQNKKFKNLFNASITTSCRKFDRFGDWYALKNPIKMIKLLKGKKSDEADKIWYDF